MRTHQSWIASSETQSTASSTREGGGEQTNNAGACTGLQSSDYKDKHSILYCHECIECSMFFKSIKTLTRHKLEQHALRPVYRCAVAECARQFEGVEDFLEHAQVHCQKNIVCLKCSIKFNSKNSLRHHMKVAHYRPTSGGQSRPARTQPRSRPSASRTATAAAKKLTDKSLIASLNQGTQTTSNLMETLFKYDNKAIINKNLLFFQNKN